LEYNVEWGRQRQSEWLLINNVHNTAEHQRCCIAYGINNLNTQRLLLMLDKPTIHNGKPRTDSDVHGELLRRVITTAWW